MFLKVIGGESQDPLEPPKVFESEETVISLGSELGRCLGEEQVPIVKLLIRKKYWFYRG